MLYKMKKGSSSVKGSIIEDDEAEVEEDEYTHLSENKEEEDISGDPEASSGVDIQLSCL